MMRRVLIRLVLCLIGALPFYSSVAQSDSTDGIESALQRLPFGIRMGQTHMNDILKRGNCAVAPEHQTSDGCLRFDMAGRFEVHHSAAGFVNKVVFSNHLSHTLPRNWRQLGLSLGIEGRQRGTEYSVFRELIRNVKSTRVVSEGIDDITLHFELGPNLYEAKFWKSDSNARPDRDRETWLWRAGLFRLEVLENY
ncbi:MAG: hypothetical protein P8077_01800 [Gammaproteobacteria bacterium]